MSTRNQTGTDPLLEDLEMGRRRAVWSMPDGTIRLALDNQPEGLLPGAFNPLHTGHVELCRAAAEVLEGEVFFELSIVNVDKPPLDFETIKDRRRQFSVPLLLTAAPRFVEKAAIVPHTTFVIGSDTLERIVLPRYYDDDESSMRAALASIRDHGGRFLVAGRNTFREFIKLSDISIPSDFKELFEELPESLFRVDLSSTELRGRMG